MSMDDDIIIISTSKPSQSVESNSNTVSPNAYGSDILISIVPPNTPNITKVNSTKNIKKDAKKPYTATPGIEKEESSVQNNHKQSVKSNAKPLNIQQDANQVNNSNPNNSSGNNTETKEVDKILEEFLQHEQQNNAIKDTNALLAHSDALLTNSGEIYNNTDFKEEITQAEAADQRSKLFGSSTALKGASTLKNDIAIKTAGTDTSNNLNGLPVALQDLRDAVIDEKYETDTQTIDNIQSLNADSAKHVRNTNSEISDPAFKRVRMEESKTTETVPNETANISKEAALESDKISENKSYSAKLASWNKFSRGSVHNSTGNTPLNNITGNSQLSYNRRDILNNPDTSTRMNNSTLNSHFDSTLTRRRIRANVLDSLNRQQDNNSTNNSRIIGDRTSMNNNQNSSPGTVNNTSNSSILEHRPATRSTGNTGRVSSIPNRNSLTSSKTAKNIENAEMKSKMVGGRLNLIGSLLQNHKKEQKRDGIFNDSNINKSINSIKKEEVIKHDLIKEEKKVDGVPAAEIITPEPEINKQAASMKDVVTGSNATDVISGPEPHKSSETEKSSNNNITENTEIKIILKNRTTTTTHILSNTSNFRVIFNTITLGERKIYYKNSVISKFSTPKILGMLPDTENVLEVKNKDSEGLKLRINVSASKFVEHTFDESVNIEGVLEYLRSIDIFKRRLVFNGEVVKDISVLDDGFCVDAV